MSARVLVGYRVRDLGPLTRIVDPYGDSLATCGGPLVFVSGLYAPRSLGRARARAERLNLDYGAHRYAVVSIWEGDPDQ